MADLGIESATIGYDIMGVQECINKLDMLVFDTCIYVINEAVPACQMATDACWRGQSADAFKKKLNDDGEVMKDTLKALKEQVVSEFATMTANIDSFDADIAEKIKSGN